MLANSKNMIHDKSMWWLSSKITEDSLCAWGQLVPWPSDSNDPQYFKMVDLSPASHVIGLLHHKTVTGLICKLIRVGKQSKARTREFTHDIQYSFHKNYMWKILVPAEFWISNDIYIVYAGLEECQILSSNHNSTGYIYILKHN